LKDFKAISHTQCIRVGGGELFRVLHTNFAPKKHELCIWNLRKYL